MEASSRPLTFSADSVMAGYLKQRSRTSLSAKNKKGLERVYFYHFDRYYIFALVSNFPATTRVTKFAY